MERDKRQTSTSTTGGTEMLQEKKRLDRHTQYQHCRWGVESCEEHQDFSTVTMPETVGRRESCEDSMCPRTARCSECELLSGLLSAHHNTQIIRFRSQENLNCRCMCPPPPPQHTSHIRFRSRENLNCICMPPPHQQVQNWENKLQICLPPPPPHTLVIRFRSRENLNCKCMIKSLPGQVILQVLQADWGWPCRETHPSGNSAPCLLHQQSCCDCQTVRGNPVNRRTSKSAFSLTDQHGIRLFTS